MTTRIELARAAMRRAFEVRRELGIDLHEPVCPIDAANRRGIEVWFSDVGSLEGLYVLDMPPRILLPSDRPFGRQVFACAHELGHHELGHGTRLDEYLAEGGSEYGSQAEEAAADLFAGAFLMPRAAIDHAFRQRVWAVESATASQIYVIAGMFGVSYEGLLTHLSVSLRALSRGRAAILRGASLPKLRESFLGTPTSAHLVVADLQWRERAIDLGEGEDVLLPKGTRVDGGTIIAVGPVEWGEWHKGARPGVCRVTHPSGWSAFVRVRRRQFCGLATVRHMEDPDVA